MAGGLECLKLKDHQTEHDRYFQTKVFDLAHNFLRGIFRFSLLHTASFATLSVLLGYALSQIIHRIQSENLFGNTDLYLKWFGRYI